MTIRTVIRAYHFDTRDDAQKQQWAALKARLQASGADMFETWGGSSHYDFVKDIDGQSIELETEHLFDNQWNTAPIAGKSDKGLRVFDWAKDYPINFSKHIKKGHYLELTDEMKEARRNRKKCGYCGRQEEAQRGTVFCEACRDSEYLEEKDLHLTRMRYVTDRGNAPPLTEAERAYLLPLYRDAQLHGSTEGGKARLAQQRKSIEKELTSTTVKAKTKHDGLLWLLDHGVKIDNVIYYDHLNRFSFGWRTPVQESFKAELLDIISEFPFAYEIKCADGKTLEGY